MLNSESFLEGVEREIAGKSLKVMLSCLLPCRYEYLSVHRSYEVWRRDRFKMLGRKQNTHLSEIHVLSSKLTRNK